MNVFSDWFVFVGVVGNQGYVSRKCIRCKMFEQIDIGMAYLHVFLITMHEIDLNWHGSKYALQQQR